MRRKAGLTAIAALLAVAPSAMAKPDAPPALARVGSWVVNYDADSCTLAGAFGDEAHRIIARMTWFGQSDTFQLILVSRQLPSYRTSTPVSIDFGPEVNPWHTDGMIGTSGALPMLMVSGVRADDLHEKGGVSDLPHITPLQEAAVTQVDVRAASSHIRLDLATFGKAMATIRGCQRDLVKTWGLDPAVQENLSREVRSITPRATWLDSDDFPAIPLREGMNGYVRFRLDVSASGAVTGCHVQMAMKPADFEKVTCDLIKRRAHLSPALDRSGKPVASYYINAVRWEND